MGAATESIGVKRKSTGGRKSKAAAENEGPH